MRNRVRHARMSRAACAAVAAVAILAVVSSNEAVPRESGALFWEPLGPGPYSVGFRVLYRRDRSRKWLKSPALATGDPGRPIRVSVWYPAVVSASNLSMKYGDYLHHLGPDGFRQVDEQLDRDDAGSWLSDLRELVPRGEPMFERLVAMPVAARRDAPFVHGPFPLVLYSGGKGSRADANVELGEFLASHGYVVATVPQLGPSDQELELGSSPQEISLHADTFDAALEALRELPEIQFDRFATAGHSAGGEAAVALALRLPEVRAVIGLDASFGMTGGARVFRQLSGYVPGRRVDAALLDLRRAEGSQGVKLDLSAIDALHWTDVYRVAFKNAYHGDFTEWGMIAWTLSIPMPPNPYGHTRRVGYDTNRRACRAVLDFLEATLRGHPERLDELKAAIRHESAVTFEHLSGSTNSRTKD